MQTAFANWLKRRRKELGASQEEFAEHIGCSGIMLRKIESGERHPSVQIAQLLANYLRIPDDEREAFIAFARTGQAASPPLSPSPSPSSSPFPSADVPPDVPPPRADQGAAMATTAATAMATAPSAAPWRSAYLHRTNLPASLTPLIGREHELAAARDQLLSPRTRLLTMTGPPGIGKTRLALQVASDFLKDFEDGVFFVDLAPLSDPEMVLPVVARAVGLAEEGDANTPIERLLLAHLRDKRLLLVLDNFEQVLDAAFYLIRLMEGSYWLKLLATSREPLHLRGERRFPVSPLPLPVLEQLPPLSKLAGYPSVELFVERARMSEPSFALTRENAAAVARICVRLDGLPLGIELAAGQTGFLSPQEIEERLTARLQLLKARERHLPERLSSLRGALDSSYNLLGERERALFRSSGVFEGGFTLRDAEAICAGGGNGDPERGPGLGAPGSSRVAETLQILVEKSLITQAHSAQGERRFGMLETIHEYALDRLREEGETEDVKRRHARHYLELSERAEAELHSAQQDTWLDRLEAEHDNLRAALDWAEANKERETEMETGLRLAGALWCFWELRNYDKEGRRRLESFIATARMKYQVGPALWERLMAPYAKALIGAGTLAYKLGASSQARVMLEESVGVYRKLNDRLGLALAFRSLGQVLRYDGEFGVSSTLIEESLAIARELGSKADTASSLYLLGILALDRGDAERAQQLLEESVTLRRALGDKAYVSKSLIWLGEVARSRGDYETARRAYEEAASLKQVAGLDLCYLLHNMGHVAHQQGDYERAAALFTESLSMSAKYEDKEATIACMCGLAAVADVTGQTIKAVRLFGATDELIPALGIHMDVADRLAYEANLARAQAHCDPATWEAARQEGRMMTLEEAVTYALAGE